MRGLRESAVIGLGVLALVLLVALATYNRDDPGFSAAGDSTVVHNRIGPIGAWFADVLFFLFGRPAFLFPVMLGASSWLLLRCGQAERGSRMNTVVRIAGFVAQSASDANVWINVLQYAIPLGATALALRGIFRQRVSRFIALRHRPSHRLAAAA